MHLDVCCADLIDLIFHCFAMLEKSPVIHLFAVIVMRIGDEVLAVSCHGVHSSLIVVCFTCNPIYKEDFANCIAHMSIHHLLVTGATCDLGRGLFCRIIHKDMCWSGVAFICFR